MPDFVKFLNRLTRKKRQNAPSGQNRRRQRKLEMHNFSISGGPNQCSAVDATKALAIKLGEQQLNNKSEIL